MRSTLIAMKMMFSEKTTKFKKIPQEDFYFYLFHTANYFLKELGTHFGPNSLLPLMFLMHVNANSDFFGQNV